MAEAVDTPRQRAIRERRVWYFAALLLLLAALVWGLLVGPLPPLRLSEFRIHWWLLIGLFYAAERWPVSVVLRNSSYFVGLAEAPLVLGLFFSTPVEVGVAYVIAMLFAASTGLKTRPMRAVLALSQSILFIGLSVIAFHAVAPGSPLDVSGWLAGYAAAFVLDASALTALAALRLYQGELSMATVRESLSLAVIVPAVNGGFGLVASVLLWQDPQELLLTVIPVAALVGLYRSYLAERRRREGMEFLRGAGEVLRSSPELEGAIVELLRSAQLAFRATLAQLTIFPTAAGENAYRTSVAGPGGAAEVMASVPLADLDDLLETDSDGIIVHTGRRKTMTEQMLHSRGIDDAMVAVLRGRDLMLGALLVGGHTTPYVDTFDNRDLQLFRTLAVQTASVLEEAHVESAVASLTALQEQLTHQALHDPLTGLPNRALFGERVTYALARTSHDNSRLAILLIDIDDFAGVNDTLGHAAGDDILVEVARRITGCLRTPDTAARWGGDEFAILLEDVTDNDEAEIVSRRAFAALKQAVVIGTDTVRLRASIGIAVSDGDTPEELLRRVDYATSAAKAQGKSCIVTYVKGMETAMVTRHQVRADLERAIERDELALHYQPLVDLATDRIVATEALLRWWHPERGLVGPDDFIGIAEGSGLIVPIGSFVLREACKQTLRWRKRYPASSDFYVSVNVSTVQLQQPLFVEEVMSCLSELKFDPAALVLELTESILLEHASPLLGKLEELRRHGIRIAIDDFGTGYSSLSYLRHLPIDILKIAKPFVDDLAGTVDRSDFVGAIVALGTSLKMTLVAEGIEQPEQLARLRAMGCGYGQGYLLGRPVTQGEIDKLLEAGGIASEHDDGQVIDLPRAKGNGPS